MSSFVLFCLPAEWMAKHGWINKWMERKKKRKNCENTLFFSVLFYTFDGSLFDRLFFVWRYKSLPHFHETWRFSISFCSPTNDILKEVLNAEGIDRLWSFDGKISYMVVVDFISASMNSEVELKIWKGHFTPLLININLE